jgi:LacI family transcriptional regulator
LITLKDIAQKSGVSISTVSHVVNNTRPVSQRAREKVLKAMKELNCSDDFPIRKKAPSRLIAIIVDDFQNPFFIEVFIAAENTSRMMGYNLVVIQSMLRDDELLYLQDLQNDDIKGFIIATRLRMSFIKAIFTMKVPIVFLGSSTEYPLSSGLILPDEKGSFLATEHLIKLGHRNILALGGSKEVLLFKNRFRGHQSALQKYGVDLNPKLQISIQPNFRESYQMMKSLLEHKKVQFSAVVTQNDITACGVMAAAREYQIKIPEEISIVGFDNTYLSQLTYPRLTSIQIPKDFIGKRLVEILIRLINGQNPETYQIEDAELIIRESTAPPKKLS